jgi:hypothetical protein
MRAAHYRAQPNAALAKLFSDLPSRNRGITRDAKLARDDISRPHAEAGEQNRFGWRRTLRERIHHALHHRPQRSAASSADDQGRMAC